MINYKKLIDDNHKAYLKNLDNIKKDICKELFEKQISIIITLWNSFDDEGYNPGNYYIFADKKHNEDFITTFGLCDKEYDSNDNDFYFKKEEECLGNHEKIKKSIKNISSLDIPNLFKCFNLTVCYDTTPTYLIDFTKDSFTTTLCNYYLTK